MNGFTLLEMRRIASRNMYLSWALSTEATEGANGRLQCVWNFSAGCNGNREISSVSLGSKCPPHSMWIFRECCKLWASPSTSSLMLLPRWAPSLCGSVLPAASVNSLLLHLVPHGCSNAPPPSLPSSPAASVRLPCWSIHFFSSGTERGNDSSS